jgi:Spy/CpxP family protein refolding chaperone
MSHHIRATILALGFAGASLPAIATAQVYGSLSGRVTTEAGLPAAGATVDIRELSIVVKTRDDGTYAINLIEGWKGKLVTVRAFAVEKGPWVSSEIRVGPGAKTLDFTLRNPRPTQLVLTVSVTSESGIMLPGAQVYINDLNLAATTSSTGMATLTIPEEQLNGRLVNLRARATGYAPQALAIGLVGGNSRLTFELKGDGQAVSEVPVAAKDMRAARDTRATQAEQAHDAFLASVAQARLSTKNPRTTKGVPTRKAGPQGGMAPSPMAGLERAAVAATPGQVDPFATYMFPPELVMQYQDAIALKDEQRSTIQSAIQEAQARMLQMQWAVAQESEKLNKTLDTTTVDEKAVQAQIDRIIGVEREIKRAQMTLLIKVKNALSAEQQAKLRQLRGGDY